MRLGISLVLLFLILGAASASAGNDASNLCREIVRHVPANDVAYRPGVDVRGRAVASADVGGTVRVEPPEEVVIDLEIPLRDLIGEDSSGLVAEAQARVGQIAVNRQSGEVRYNGQLLNSDELSGLQTACLRVVGPGSD